MEKKTECLVHRYARLALAGKIVVGKWVRLACERHLHDLKTGHGRGIYFDEKAANRAIRFFRFLKHSKGEWAGQRFDLELWQAFIVGSLFGWKREDGTRRFRQGFTEIARNNGKTTLAAGVGLLLLVADDEPGAEIYTAATKRDQARITHSEATRMVRQSKALRQRVRIFKDNLNIPDTASKYEPLGADANTTSGLNLHGAIVDELHEHKTRDMVDVLETATGSRRQPLIFEITTAGLAGESIYNEHHDYGISILEGTIEDDTWFAYIATMDEGDDWTSRRAWAKANPNLGICVKLDDLRRKCRKAKQIPAAQNVFLRLHANVRTQQITRWIDLATWDANAEVDGRLHVIDEEKLRGRACYGGLDLGAVADLTAWLMVFPWEDNPEEVDILARFWCPEAALKDRHNRYRAQYVQWARMGLLRTTPGNATDYEFVKAAILEDAATFGLVDLNVDRLFQAHQLASDLTEEGLTVVGMGQGFLSMAAPMRTFEEKLLAGLLHHGGNPVLRWMANNVAVKHDAAGSVKPDKDESQGRIDGIVALVMALDRLMRHEDKQVEWAAV
ncbi:hypothetical protein LCGC14_1278660 [marine sediment metagenome]|uniref:Terminase large subunit n=1 Tax=marine sediment metagenome TaxID=412755 RepID=A0A0F9NCK3_9ZZZZ